MTLGTFHYGQRCTAADGLGNRCVKDATHFASTHAAERWHDASRGSLERRWV